MSKNERSQKTEDRSQKLNDLRDRTIVISRTSDQIQPFKEYLELRGAHVLVCPLIMIKPKVFDKESVVHRNYDWVIFTSAHAVSHFLNPLVQDIGLFKTAKVCAIGESTQNQLSKFRINATIIPQKSTQEGIIDYFKNLDKNKIKGASILIPEGNLAFSKMPDTLERLGAKVTKVDCYTNTCPDALPKEVINAFQNKTVDVMVFTSPSTITHFFQLLQEGAAQQYLNQTTIACIGPTTKDALLKRNLKCAIMPTAASLAALAEEIAKHQLKCLIP